MTQNLLKKWTSILLCFCIATSPASQANQSIFTSIMTSLFSMSPTPNDKDSFESQLKRYNGQTKFLNIEYAYSNRSRAGMPEAAPSLAAKDGGQREQQESDVYKIGPKDSKLLYLLNDYRGLQAISFAQGAKKPVLLGHTEATGNYSDSMYIDSKRNNIIVLERNWYDTDTDQYNYSEEQSRILIYSVADPKKPTLTNTINIKGEIADSRIVGNILYIATSIRPNWNERNQNNAQYKGNVYSFKMNKKEGVTLVDEQSLTLSVDGRENMNIIETKNTLVNKESGEYLCEQSLKYCYYLVAVLNKNAWGFWNNETSVEVVNVSDPKGSIQPVMAASVRGNVRERSQTSIQNGTLIVTSNYWDRSNRDNRAIIMVESFKLPNSKSEKISTKEFEYRKMHIDRELENSKGLNEAQLEAKKKELLADKKLGIQDRFVKGETTLSKMVPDGKISLRDTMGLNANLQDVRYVDDKLYIFWVPANMIDPFDLVDLSNPVQPKHLKRLQYEGWIERSIPVKYLDRNFVLGLGWEIPAVDNERGRRVPTVKLIEVKENAGQYKVEEISSFNLAASNFYTDFNRGDKFVEVKMGENGKGSILFSGSQYSPGNYRSGAKLVGFDLQAGAEDRFGEVFSEGKFLAGNSGWLKRVFSNPEIDDIQAINTFSNTALATYDATASGNAEKDANAVSILELARNIQSVKFMTKELGTYGLQIISDFSWYNSSDEKDNGTSLRLVNLDNIDAELDQALYTLKIPGTYQSAINLGDESILILSETSIWNRTGNDWKHEYAVHLSKVEYANGLVLAAQKSWKGENQTSETNFVFETEYAPYRYGYQRASLIPLSTGQILVSLNGSVRILDPLSRSFELKELKVNSCATKNRVSTSFQELGNGELIYSSKEMVKDPARENFMYSRGFIAKATLDESTITCESETNIPGSLVNISDGYIITQDKGLISSLPPVDEKEDDNDDVLNDNSPSASPVPGRMPPPYWYRPDAVKTKQSLLSLAISNGTATLNDEYSLENVRYSNLKALPNGEVFMTLQSIDNSYGYSPWGRPSPRLSETRFTFVGLENGNLVESNVFFEQGTLPTQSTSAVNLVSLIPDPQANDNYLALVTSGRKAFVVSVNKDQSAPTVLKTSLTTEKEEGIKVPGAWSIGDVSFDSASQTFVLSLGMSGAKSFKIYR